MRVGEIPGVQERAVEHPAVPVGVAEVERLDRQREFDASVAPVRGVELEAAADARERADRLRQSGMPDDERDPRVHGIEAVGIRAGRAGEGRGDGETGTGRQAGHRFSYIRGEGGALA